MPNNCPYRIFKYINQPHRDVLTPPWEIAWASAGLSGRNLLTCTDKGDYKLREYSRQNENQEREIITVLRYQNFDYSVDPVLGVVLRYDQQPGWVDGDGVITYGDSSPKTVFGTAYISWTKNARENLFQGWLEWIPSVLVALELAVDKIAAQILARAWYRANHEAAIASYLRDGDATDFRDSLATDTTDWLDLVVPEGVVPGLYPVPELNSEKTVREMIDESIR